MFKRVLLLGGTGLLGYAWTNSLLARGIQVFSSVHNRCPETEDVFPLNLDFTNEDNLQSCFRQQQFDLVINLIAITSVEKCSLFPALAMETNALLVERIAKVCHALHMKFVHLSTDQVFDGKTPFNKETDSTNPVNEYGITKALAESSVIRMNPAALIIRTNFFCRGPAHRPSFYDQIVESLRLSESMGLFSDVYFTPIAASELICIVEVLVQKNRSGIYHVVGSERISKYHFGILVAESLEIKPESLIQSSLLERRDLVKRPLDMSLSNSKIKNEIEPMFEGLRASLKKIAQDRNNER